MRGQAVPPGDDAGKRFRIMVASRCPYRLDSRAVPISSSTSLAVRYSRVRPTEEFTVFGANALATAKAMEIPHPDSTSEEIIRVFPSVIAHVAGKSRRRMAARRDSSKPNVVRTYLKITDWDRSAINVDSVER